MNKINEVIKYIERANQLIKEKKYIKAYKLLSKEKKLRRTMNIKNNTVKVEFENDTKKREWGSKDAKCFVCEFGWSKSGEPCNNFDEGVGKEGIGNNCSWFKWSSDMFGEKNY